MAKSRQSKSRITRQGLRRESTPKSHINSLRLSSELLDDQSAKPIAFYSTRLVVWQFSVKTERIKWNPGSKQFFGLTAKEKLPKNVDELLAWLYTKERRKFRDAIRRALKNQTEFVFEAKVFMPDGTFKWLEFIAEPQPSRSQKAAYFAGIIQDITERKLTQFELVDWKRRNELISESASLIIYDYDIASGEIFWSGNTQQLFGFTPMEIGSIAHWAERVHPADRIPANTLLAKARREFTPFNIQYRFCRKDGGYCYVHDRGMFVPDATGNAVRMLGLITDISERMEAYRTIEQSEKSYRELFNTVGEAIYIQKPDGTFVDVNQGACRMYGYSREEFIGRNPEFLSAPGKNDYELLSQQMQLAMQGVPQTFRWWGKKKSGEVFIKKVNLTKGTYFGEEIMITTAWDITDRIASEQSLKESERRFRRLVSDLNVGVILVGPRGEVQVANRASLCLLGIHEDETLDANLFKQKFDFVEENGKPLPETKSPWVIASQTRKAQRGIVFGIRNSSDSVVWMLANAEPILSDDHLLMNVVVTLTDITERKKIEEELKESELRFRTLQEASFGGIGLHNNGIIIDCNQGLCNLSGFSYEELIGSNGVNLIAPEYRDFVRKQIAARVQEPYDVQGIRKDGSRYYLEIHGKNIPYKEGLIRVTEFRDITERKAAEARMLEQNARLTAITEDLKLKNEQLQEFTQIVSHNLRSPVGNILSLLQFLEGAESDAERSEYIELLKEAGTSTLTTLQELNDVLKIKQDKNIPKQKLEFEQVFSNVKRMLVAKIVETGANVTSDFSEAPSIEYPNIYLESILLNLLSNALKYHHPDRLPQINVRTFLNAGGICLEVRDNGKGLNMERYGHQIFKLRKTFHRHPESRGIGLFMIKNQIEAMGGEISMQSIENQGSIFLINFSARIQHDNE